MYLHITALLIVACSSDSQKLIQRGRNFNELKIRFWSTQRGPTLCILCNLITSTTHTGNCALNFHSPPWNPKIVWANFLNGLDTWFCAYLTFLFNPMPSQRHLTMNNFPYTRTSTNQRSGALATCTCTSLVPLYMYACVCGLLTPSGGLPNVSNCCHSPLLRLKTSTEEVSRVFCGLVWTSGKSRCHPAQT